MIRRMTTPAFQPADFRKDSSSPLASIQHDPIAQFQKWMDEAIKVEPAGTRPR